MKYLLVFLLATCIAYADTEIDEFVSLAENNVLTPGRVRPEIRDEVIVHLRAKLHPDDPCFPMYTSDSLVALGDEQTIERVIRQIKEKAAKTGTWYSIGQYSYPQPLLIPYLAEDFFRDDGDTIDEQVTRRDLDHLQISIGRVLDVLNILRRSPAFSEDMHKWSENTIAVPLKLLDISKCRQVMRSWWLENKEHFAKRDYASVRPGAPLGRNIAKAGAYDNDPAYASQPTPNVPAAIAAPSTAVPRELGSKPHGFITVVALSILAIAAGGFYFLRKK